MSPDQFALLTLAAYACVALALVVWQARRCREGWGAWILYALLRLYILPVFRWRANRACPYPEEGPALIIANHRSPVDPFYLTVNQHIGRPSRRFRIISFLMAREYYEQRGCGWALRTIRTIPVSRNGRDTQSVKDALRMLKAGNLVAVFPEGRINTNASEDLLPAGSGVAWLALTAEVPVCPVFIHNAPRRHDMLSPFLSPRRVRLTYGDPVELSEYYGRKKSPELLQEVTAKLMHRLEELGGLVAPDPERPESIKFPEPECRGA